MISDCGILLKFLSSLILIRLIEGVALVEWNNPKDAYAINVFEGGHSKVLVYNKEGDLLQTIDYGSPSKVTAMAFNGYKQLIAVGCQDGSVYVVDAKKRFPPQRVIAPTNVEVAMLSFDSDLHKVDEQLGKKNAWMSLGFNVYNVLWVIGKNSNVQLWRFTRQGKESVPIFEKQPAQNAKLTGTFAGARRKQVPDPSNGYFTNELVVAHGYQIHQFSFTSNRLLKEYPSSVSIDYFDLSPDHCIIPLEADQNLDPCADNAQRYVALLRENNTRLHTLVVDDLTNKDTNSPRLKVTDFEYSKHPTILYGRKYMASDNRTHVFVQSLEATDQNFGIDKGNDDLIVGIALEGTGWDLYIGTVKGDVFVFSATATDDGQPSWEWDEDASSNMGENIASIVGTTQTHSIIAHTGFNGIILSTPTTST